MIKAAEKQDKLIGVQGNRYEGYMVWINALVESAGGQIITNVDAGKDARPAIASPAGDAPPRSSVTSARSKAARRRCRPPARRRPVRRSRADGGVHGQLAVRLRRGQGRRESGALTPVRRRRHRLGPVPAGRRRQAQQPPLGGINLAIGAFTKHPTQALDAGQVHHLVRATCSTWSTRATRRPRPPPTTTRRCARRSRWRT